MLTLFFNAEFLIRELIVLVGIGTRQKFDKIGLNITYVKNYQVKYQAITTKLTSDNKRNNKCQFF